MTSVNCNLTKPDQLWCNGTEYHEAGHVLTPEDTWFWIYLGIYTALVIGAGLMSGLTIGLLSLDPLSLKVLGDSGTGDTRKYARRLFPIIRRHHWLLVTLLLGNAACVEAMPIFLDRVSDPVIAIVVSVTAVLFFGEVIPQALCTKFGLAIGYYCTPIVYLFMGLLSPVAYPLSKLLDLILGEHHETVFRKEELKSLVSYHGPRLRRDGNYLVESGGGGGDGGGGVGREKSASGGGRSASAEEDRVSAERRNVLSFDEASIIKGALELSSIPAEDACTPIDQTFMLSDACCLTDAVRLKVIANAHSRVPVYRAGNRNDIRGHLLVKMLLLYAREDEVPFEVVITDKKCFREMPYVHCQTPLYDLLNIFQQGKSHMAVVFSAESAAVRGIITLEDVLERLLMEPIRDEADDIREEIGRSLRRGLMLRQVSAAAFTSGAAIRRMASVVSAGTLAGCINAGGESVAPASETTPLLHEGGGGGRGGKLGANSNKPRRRTFGGGCEEDDDNVDQGDGDIGNGNARRGFLRSETIPGRGYGAAAVTTAVQA